MMILDADTMDRSSSSNRLKMPKVLLARRKRRSPPHNCECNEVSSPIPIYP
jgi:hypothetical protein